MSTAEIRRRKRRRHDSRYEEMEDQPRRGLRWRGMLLLFLVLVAGVIYLAPAIVAHTPLGGIVLERAMPINGKLSVGRASLGWFSTIVAEDIEIHDSHGDRVVKIDFLTSDKPLIGILLEFPDLGKLRVARPDVHIVARQTDTNLEEILAPLLASKSDLHPTAQLEVTDGTISIDDIPAGRQFRLSKFSVDCSLNDSLVLATSASLTGGGQEGSFKIDLAVKGLSNDLAGGSGKIDCRSSAVPLELIEPIARRKMAGARLSGLVSTRIGGAWGDMAGGGDSAVHGEVLIKDLDFSAAALKDDHIRFDHIEIPCHMAQKGDWVQIEKLGIRCELGEVALSGSAKLSDLTAQDRLARLAHDSCELKGQVDLARLAGMLPNTLRLRQGTQITSGALVFDAVAHPETDGMQWTGRVDTGALAATVGGKPVSWDNPLSIELAARETKDGIVLERGRCISSFLQIDAEGVPDHWTASADFDLVRLVSELSRFCDLDNLQLAGHGQAQLVYKHTLGDQFWSRAEFHARGFRWIVPGAQPWTEDDLIVMLEASGHLQDKKIGKVDQAQFTVTAGGERADAELREAIQDPLRDAWPLQCTWSGDLAHWAPRLESLCGISGWQVAGKGTMQAVILASPKVVELGLAETALTQFKLLGHGCYIQEPAIKVEAAGKCDLATGRIELAKGKLSTGTVEAEATSVVISRESTGLSLDAAGRVSAELAQLYRWLHDPRTPDTWQISGRLTGQAHLKTAQGTTSAELDGTITEFEIFDRSPGASSAPAWEESRVTLAARGNYAHTSDKLQVDKLQLACQGLRCDANGVVPLTASGNVELKGNVEYDWEQLAPLWRPYLGDHVTIAGRQSREFNVHGKLGGEVANIDSWRGVTADAAMGWTSMDVFGLAVGRGDVVARLADNEVRTLPIDIDISGGRMTLAPLVRLDARGSNVFIGRGPLLTDVQLSEQQCSRGLKFITPILADSTTANGRFSVTLEGARIPLGDPRAADIGGSMALRAQAKPGPVAREFLVLIRELTAILQRGPFAGLTDQDGSIVSVDDSNIEFRCVNGRVYHRNLSFRIGNMPISTYGSVGLDESLSVVAEVPLQAKLFGLDLSLGTLEGRVVQIPIGGTLENPKLDPRALQQLATQTIQNTAKGLLIDGVEKQLERLLPAK